MGKVFLFLFCFVFPSKCSIPHHNLGSGWFFFCLAAPVDKVFCFLLFSVCLFVFILFCFVLFFVFASKNSIPPLISNGAPLTLFYYTDDGGHYVIDNFELPCNSVKNLIPIWNFTNTFIQECEIKWEFQIRWGGTSLLRPLWRSWLHTHWCRIQWAFKIFKIWFFFFFFFFLHFSVALL